MHGINRDFNSHAHVERDTSITSSLPVESISTHTLTWSVTASSYSRFLTLMNFNSHAHVERDNLRLSRVRTMAISTHTLTWSVTGTEGDHRTTSTDFNSHAHVERDNSSNARSWAGMDFNSHAHVERDILVRFFGQYIKISTHTLTWSVTFLCRRAAPALLFQLTRSRGA